MKALWIKYLAWIHKWPDAAKEIRAAMITPIFVMRDAKRVRDLCRKLKNSPHYTCANGLVDLQDGRDYIFRGRTADRLNSKTERNIRICLNEGVTPLIITLNTWAARHTETDFFIPSWGGIAPKDQRAFFNDVRLAHEIEFLKSLKPYWKYVHFQLSIEVGHPDGALFALTQARWLRGNGFRNRILINPYTPSLAAHEELRKQFDDVRVDWARTYSGRVPPPPNYGKIWNSDGCPTTISHLSVMRDFGEHIVWSGELAQGELPAEYL